MQDLQANLASFETLAPIIKVSIVPCFKFEHTYREPTKSVGNSNFRSARIPFTLKTNNEALSFHFE